MSISPFNIKVFNINTNDPRVRRLDDLSSISIELNELSDEQLFKLNKIAVTHLKIPKYPILQFDEDDKIILSEGATNYNLIVGKRIYQTIE